MTTTKFTNAAIIIGVMLLLVLPACAAQISVTDINPHSGYNNDTIAITNLSGDNFNATSKAYLEQGGTRQDTFGTVYLISPQQLACSFNLVGLAAGSWNVTVYDTTNSSNNASKRDGFTVLNPIPVLTDVNPKSGTNNYTAFPVTITGSKFLTNARVNVTNASTLAMFNADSVVVNPAGTEITCTLNLATRIGAWQIYVTNTDGQRTPTSINFTIYNPVPTITTPVSPPTGINSNPNLGVTIYGSNFIDGVTVNYTQGTNFIPKSVPTTWVNSGQINTGLNLVGVPVGSYNVTVSNPGALYNNTTAVDAFRVFYPAPPVVSSINPPTGNNTENFVTVQIVGSGFHGNAIVNLTRSSYTNITGTVTSYDLTTINCTLPILGKTAGIWNVVVTNNDTQSSNTDVPFTIITPPASITNLHNTTYLPTSITWAWTDPTTLDFNHVKVYLDGTFMENVAKGNQTYTASSLTPGTEHTISTHTVGTTGLINQTWVNLTNWTSSVATPVTSFTGIPRSGTTTSLNVQFNDTSTGTDISSYQWIFGDSATVYPTRNLTHAFAPGIWNVNHSVTNSTGTTSWKNETGYIIVTAPTDPPVANFTGIPRSGTTTSLNVQFNDTSTGTGLTSYQWIFGDNATVYTTQNLMHAFAPGTWNVNHSVTNSTGTTSWKNETGYITVTAPPFPPIANFTASPRFGFKPLLVQFNDTSVSGITEWKWTLIGDEVIYLNKNPLYTYNEIGNYTVKLKVWNATGDDKITKNEYIVVTNRPVADFTANPTNGTAPMNVTFTSDSDYATGWLWTFGDGSNSTQENPSHTYTTTGVKEVTLRVFNAGGEGTPKTKTVTVRSACPVANFTATPTKGDVSLNVQFTDTSTGTITGRNWDFGDGGTSTLANPAHTYVTPGVYSVRLEVYNLDCSNTTTKPALINATQPKPVADFTGSPENGTTKVTTFSFYDLSTNNPTSWLWNFGDGTTSTLKNPTHIYQTSGNWYVTLISSNAGGASAPKMRGPIAVTNPAPVANFTGTPRLGSLPLTVQFTDTSTGMPTAWIWDFGDSTIGTGANPVHTYSQAGSYTVFMTAIDSTTGLSNTTPPRVAYITVTKTPFAAFTASPTSGPSPLVVRFTDQSQGNPFRFYWKFGDGTFSNAKNPTHVYQKPGNYTVTLTVQSLSGYNSIIKQNLVTVTQLPQASFIVNATSGTSPTSIKFTDTSTAVPNPNSWTWDFGDASTGPERFVKSPVHTYVSPGVYSVRLTVSNGMDSSTVTKPSLITIGATAGAEFTFKPVEGDVPLAIQFTDKSTGDPTSYRWQFGDGSVISREKNPIHTYTKPGDYTVTLTITSRTGTVSSVSHEVVLTGKPIASFNANPTAGTSPLTVQFTDTSSNNPTYYFWNYDDGTFGNDTRNPVHTYNSPGTFNVTLFVSNQYDDDTSPPTQISVSQFP